MEVYAIRSKGCSWVSSSGGGKMPEYKPEQMSLSVGGRKVHPGPLPTVFTGRVTRITPRANGVVKVDWGHEDHGGIFWLIGESAARVKIGDPVEIEIGGKDA